MFLSVQRIQWLSNFIFYFFSELFPAFNWAKAIGNLQRIWFVIKNFSPYPD